MTHVIHVIKTSDTSHTAKCECRWKGTRAGGPDNGYTAAEKLGKQHVGMMAELAIPDHKMWPGP